MESVKLEVRIPSNFAAKAFSALRKYSPSSENWLADGSLVCVVELPAGAQSDFIDEVQKVVHGNLVSRVIN
ncbi:MAG: hypothetical protein GOV15_02930 [Candidatus Diapherotrites archaeon]|nr:hypothetical protein [Candidatus Diapherotrites archaeon]